MRGPWHKWRWAAVLGLAFLSIPISAAGFPAVFVGRTGASGIAHTAHVVVMLNGPISVVTMMVDYAGPLEPFALLMPVPSDVTLERVHSLKREFVARLEQLSAPRFHAFYEQDPCDGGPTEQDWDVRYQAGDSGFLAPEFLPPPERHWTVSNDISVPTEPVFKTSESEFHFQMPNVREPREISHWLTSRGYPVPPDFVGALAQRLQQSGRLLVAEVNPQRAELLADGGLQLGAIRYWTRESAMTIASTLGKLNSAGFQDLFVYVLHPSLRFQAGNYENVVLPSNLEIDAAGAEHLGAVYNALFDAQQKRKPRSVVTEYAWPSAGCGEPCPNAPLTLSELMSLGGDVMEAKLVTLSARAPEPDAETDEEKQLFEMQIQGKSAPERAQALKQHKNDRRELARRRAMMARQRYVVTRLHLRYDAKALANDLELQAAADQLQGGIGLPSGPKGVLFNGARAGKTSHYQVRFTSLFTWPHPYQCQAPVRWRWGRRWKSLDTALRKVWLASDLPRQARDSAQLSLIQTPVAELGIVSKVNEPSLPLPARTASPRTKPVARSGCCLSSSSAPVGAPLACVLVGLIRICQVCRRRRDLR